MNLKLKSVSDKGDLEKERLVLRVLKDDNISDYAVLRTGYGKNGGPTTKVFNTFWVASKKLEAGDLVVIYSKAGKTNQKQLENGHNAHFFYWGNSEALWGTDDKVAVLLHSPEWDSKSVDKL